MSASVARYNIARIFRVSLSGIAPLCDGHVMKIITGGNECGYIWKGVLRPLG